MKQLIIVRKDLIERYGYPKMMVQVAHASTKIITDIIGKTPIINNTYLHYNYDTYPITLSKEIQQWINGSYKKILVYVKSEEKLLKIYEHIKDKYPSVLIKDHALTVYPEPMNTCVGIMGSDEDMDEVSKKYHLQLLK